MIAAARTVEAATHLDVHPSKEEMTLDCDLVGVRDLSQKLGVTMIPIMILVVAPSKLEIHRVMEVF